MRNYIDSDSRMKHRKLKDRKKNWSSDNFTRNIFIMLLCFVL